VNSYNENGEPIVPEAAAPKVTDIMEDEDEEDIDALVARVPDDTKTLEECIIGSQGCLLLLMLKQHLKDTYGLTEAYVFKQKKKIVIKISLTNSLMCTITEKLVGTLHRMLLKCMNGL